MNARTPPPLSAALAAADFWRRSPHERNLPVGYKEWSHYSILGADFDLIVNFSFAVQPTGVQPRLTVLFSDAEGRWDGDVTTTSLSEVALHAGAPDVVMGAASARLGERGYRLEAALTERDLTVNLNLTPLARPVVAPTIRLEREERLSWAVVPRLVAEGEIKAAGRRRVVAASPAYHDRNWGRFAWGGDYAWEWATLLPEDPAAPWSLVYSRIADRARAATTAQSLIVWRGETPLRKFYGRDLAVSQEGAAPGGRPFRLPRISALVGSGLAADTPRRLTIVARAYDDHVKLELEFDRFAQVVVPNDVWPGLTALSEASGRVRASGRIAGERVEFSGRTQAEFNHAA